jgi:putative DNA primase/helicase
MRQKPGYDREDATEWLGGQRFANGQDSSPARGKAKAGRIVATYPYVDENGELLFKVDRFEPKTFRQRRPDGHGGWIWNLDGVRRVPYRLPEVVEAVATSKTIHITEGEKDADNLWALGIPATTNPGGARKWRQEYAKHLRGANVVLHRHNDNSGRDHMREVAASLAGIAARVRVLDIAKHWPECPPKGDISNWIEKGGTVETFWELVDLAPEPDDDQPPREAKATSAPLFSDEDLALRFADRHQDDLRFVAKFGRWLAWHKTCWRFDDTMAAYDLVRALCRDVAAHANKDGIRLASAKTVAACERLARTDRRLAATSDQWDVDPFLLATPAGVVDLRTGQLRAARQSDYMTKLTGVGPGGACPRWRKFLKRITAENTELEAFIQRMLGYGLTGVTIEHAMFFAYGTGANGKSVLLSTVAGILGDYHSTAPIEAFVASYGERHPTDLAGLRGARLVTAIETEEGRRWAENKLKALTGGDRIAARFMRQDFFEFLPVFKLLVAGNHKPALRSVDEAIKRRLHLIPFTVIIPVEERNKNLTEELKAEWPGILAWMIEGCLQWQRVGLDPPDVVRTATESYFADQDLLSQWLEEACDAEPGNEFKTETVAALYESWSTYADKNNSTPGGKNDFGDRLESKGFTRHRTRQQGRHFRGIRLKYREGDAG